MKLYINILISSVIILLVSNGYCDDKAIKRIDRERRIALVIGNSAYQYAGNLQNPVNDAEDISQILTELDFQVICKKDVSLNIMNDAIYQFGELLKGGGIGLFYFSGHGMQVKGENYLLPVDANIQREDQIRYRAINASDVLIKMDEAKTHLNLVFLDACRNDPFPRSFRSPVRGLADMKAPTGTLLIYATNPGNTAADGTGQNSPYTKNLLRYIREPNLEIGMMLRKIRTSVREETGGRQIPWENGSIEGEFFFVQKTTLNDNIPESIAINPGKPEIFSYSAPSFDCDKATTKIEKLICNNQMLSEIDGRMGKIYSQLRKSLSKSEADKLKKQQIDWINRRNEKMINICLNDNYLDIDCSLVLWEKRIKELEAMIQK